MKLKGKVALVTGGSRGIGRGICLALAGEGARVAVNYIHGEEAAAEVVRTIQERGGDAWLVQADVSKGDEVAKMVDATVAHAGRLDILVNNAGIGIPATLLELTEENWDRVMGVNLKGIYLCSQAAARYMIRQSSGWIVNITSVMGQQIWAGGSPHYCASKAGADHLTRAMAVELAPYGIRVNGIAPGSILTDMLRHDLSLRPGSMDATVGRTPAGRLGEPADIARAVVYLCADSDFVVGQILTVDGGYTLRGEP